MWTHFWDMHSGGGTKEEPYNHIYIEAPEKEATVIFYNRFGHNPNRVTCTCCGEDYSINSNTELTQLTAHHRGCRWDNVEGRYVDAPAAPLFGRKFQLLDQYKQSEGVLFIHANEIRPEEREGDVPEQGYTWKD